MLCNHTGHSSLDLHSYDWPFMQKIKVTIDEVTSIIKPLIVFPCPLSSNHCSETWLPRRLCVLSGPHDITFWAQLSTTAAVCTGLQLAWHPLCLPWFMRMCGERYPKKKKSVWEDEVRKWVIRPQCCCSVRSSLWEAAAMHASQLCALICGEMTHTQLLTASIWACKNKELCFLRDLVCVCLAFSHGMAHFPVHLCTFLYLK